jgi:nuclear GTP-binding protein
MILNDWIRGKIPFYVMPPERTVEESVFTATENKTVPVATETTTADTEMPDADIESAEAEESPVKKASKAKGRGVTIGVEQIFSKIPVLTKFLPDDLAFDKELADEERKCAAVKDAEKAEAGERKVKEKKSGAVADDVPDWDEVFGSVVGEVTSVGPDGSNSEESEDETSQPETTENVKITNRKQKRKRRRTLYIIYFAVC